MRRFGTIAVSRPVKAEHRASTFARSLLLAALAQLVVLALSGNAAAQSAHDLYEQGMQALSAGRYADAVQALDASYRKEPAPSALYNLGLAYKGMGHPDRALEAFENFVKYANPKKEKKTIEAVRAEIDRIKSSYARFALKLTPADAAIEIDGAPATASKGELWVQKGQHKISVQAEGYESYEQALDVAPGHFDLEVHLRVPSGPPEARAAALVDEGIALQAAGSMALAIDKYNAAQKIYPTPRAAAQMGLAEESQGDLPAAEKHIEEALKTPKDPFIRENRRRLRAARDRIKQQLGTLIIKGTPDGAEIFVNGKSVGTLPIGAPVRVVAGSLTVGAKKQGYSDFELVIDLPRRGQRPIRIKMDEAPPVPLVAAVPLPGPSGAAPPPEAAVPALTEQPPVEPVPPEQPPPEQKAPAQADIEAAAEPQQEPEPQQPGPRPSATGFEMALNFGYQPFIGGPKTAGSSGLLSPQILLGARFPWFLSFGVQINGGFDLSPKGTSFVGAANPGLYVRGHIQQEKKRLSFDGWAGLGIQPVAVQFAVLKAGNTNLDPNTVDPNSAQAKQLQQSINTDHVHTIQSINLPFELGGTFFITEGFGVDLTVGLTLWMPQQSCLHDAQNRLCTDTGLKSQTSMFFGGGLSFLP